MGSDHQSNALIDPRKLNIYELARRANVTIPANNVESPPHERLTLGRLTGITGIEHTELGEAIRRKVRLYEEIMQTRPESYRQWVASYAQYLEALARKRSEEYESFDRSDFTKDFQGYVSYLCELDSSLAAAIMEEVERPHYVLETRDRKAHSLVTGGSRSGKTELLKLLIHHYVKHPELGGVLVLDPHADMAKQVARWREFKGKGEERLVYLDAEAGEEAAGMVPALNPLVPAKGGRDTLALQAGQLATALAYFGGQEEGQTPQMHRVATYCLRVLLDMENSTLVDMMRGLTVPQKRGRGEPKPPEPEFVRRGKAHADEVVRDFFTNDWDGESYRGTRDALKRRLQTYMLVPSFREMITAPAPLNLEAQLNAGKVVVVNCATGGEAGLALGRFIMAQVAAMGQRRLENSQLERHPVHVFADEATQLMAPPFLNILERFAKAGIWLTMGQQGAGEGGGREFINRVKRSTKLKFVGGSGATREVAQMVDVNRAELPTLKQGQFIVAKTGEEKSPALLDVLNPSPLADNNNAMSAAEFAAVMRKQLAAYYRPGEDPGRLPPALPSPNSAAGGWVDE